MAHGWDHLALLALVPSRSHTAVRYPLGSAEIINAMGLTLTRAKSTRGPSLMIPSFGCLFLTSLSLLASEV